MTDDRGQPTGPQAAAKVQAVLSVLCGLVPVGGIGGPPAIVLGVLALRDRSMSSSPFRWMARIGIGLGVVQLIAAALIVTWALGQLASG